LMLLHLHTLFDDGRHCPLTLWEATKPLKMMKLGEVVYSLKRLKLSSTITMGS
jgi:hypothetical protein